MKINGFQEQFDDDMLFRFKGQAAALFFKSVQMHPNKGFGNNMDSVKWIQDTIKPEPEGMWTSLNKYGEFIPHIV